MKTKILASIFAVIMLTSFAYADDAVSQEEALREGINDKVLYVEKEDIKEIEAKKILEKTEVDDKTYYKVKVDDAIEEAEKVDGALYEDVIKTAGYTSDPYNNAIDSAHLYNTGIFELYKKGVTGEGVEIAVIDSGLSLGCSEISDNIDWDYAFDAQEHKKLTRDYIIKEWQLLPKEKFSTPAGSSLIHEQW